MLQAADEEEDIARVGQAEGVTFYFVYEDANTVHGEVTARGI